MATTEFMQVSKWLSMVVATAIIVVVSSNILSIISIITLDIPRPVLAGGY